MDAILKYAESLGYDDVMDRGTWGHYSVYEMVFDTDAPMFTGLPQYILWDKGEMRLADVDEIFNILDHLERAR